MVKATKIRMKTSCYYSNDVKEIDSIYLDGSLNNPGWFKKEIVYNYIKFDAGIVYVNISPNPKLIPEISINGEKYVRSEPDYSGKDNLLSLPRE